MKKESPKSNNENENDGSISSSFDSDFLEEIDKVKARAQA